MWLVVTNKLKTSIEVLGNIKCINRNITPDDRIFYVVNTHPAAIRAAAELRRINRGKNIRVYIRKISASEYNRGVYST
jgi:hypothetical protein